MSSIYRRLIDRLYPDNVGPQVTFLGLDSSGKTTLLYLLKLGEIVQTIPSIGFNVETVDVPTLNGKTFRIYGWDVGTGCGITYLYRIIEFYVRSTKALVWLVDASDKERLAESVEALQRVLDDSSKPNSESAGIGKELPILILANKSDKPDAMSLDHIRIAFAKTTSGRMASIFKTSLTKNTIVETGLPEAFAWLQLALDIASSGKNTTLLTRRVHSEKPDPNSASSLAHKLESWLTRIETDVARDEFLDRFNTFTLPGWDHYTHIRIAYVILTKYGRREGTCQGYFEFITPADDRMPGKDLVFEGLEKYISVSPQTKGKSFHVTMTYFWIQIVHFGIRNMPPPTTHEVPEASVERRPSNTNTLDDFSRFLLINPYVVDGNLWTDYYTKDVMMSPKAKGEMVLPDKKPLPNLVIRDTITKFGSKG